MTTPERVFLAFNWLFHSWHPGKLFDGFRVAVTEALDSAMVRFESQARIYGEITGRQPQGRSRAPQVITFEALQQLAGSVGGSAALVRLDQFARDLAATENPLIKTRCIVDAMVTEARIGGPAVIIGFASLYYPHTHLDPENEEHRALTTAIESTRVAFEEHSGQSLMNRDTFLGISDMSFLGHSPETSAVSLIAANTPAPDLVDRPAPDALRFPAVNIGPWGRDYHQRLERVHAKYAFRTLPRLLDAIQTRFLSFPA